MGAVTAGLQGQRYLFWLVFFFWGANCESPPGWRIRLAWRSTSSSATTTAAEHGPRRSPGGDGTNGDGDRTSSRWKRRCAVQLGPCDERAE